MPHIESELKTGDIRETLRRGGIVEELKTGHITSVFKVIIGGSDTTDDVLLESGSFMLMENGSKILLG